jgi:hypothetical protein
VKSDVWQRPQRLEKLRWGPYQEYALSGGTSMSFGPPKMKSV